MQNILLVDDDPSLRDLVAKMLTRPHRTIDVATHGEQAIERIAARKPHLLITDVVMPRMNGWALVRQLRSIPSTAFIPVIFMTALDDPKFRLRGFRIGADDFITKPLDFDELERRVESVLFRSRADRGGAALSGDLSQFGLATPLTILEMERKTGLLAIDHPPRHALLVVKDGRVIHAELDGRKLEVLDCLCEVLSWASGRFTFTEQLVSASATADVQPTTALLLDAARKLDELPAD
ncbi:MAG TPA: response regulator [Polyangiaceae bacterium]|jgi:DNA-binding response OmpR family regulator|nr:response regulator [Polyangiaceae bacterium]